MVALFYSVLNYIKQPRLKRLRHTSFEKKFTIVIQCVALSLIIGISLGVFPVILELLGLYQSDTHAIARLFEEESPLYIVFSAVILAPVVEEIIFRGPLTLFGKKYFRIVFYAFALLFGYMHLFNFNITTQILILSPLLVATQIILGLVFGYIRVRFGLIYSILLHMFYNGIIVIPVVLVMS
ncbi:CPBP family intramembrane glutamic endopeptidase [Olleya sp. R77988]|uniref:CPBP family intramembrane glutamic endopeptidase n=1 Tax=Olleya sp. R77988 TaxID=3093875 RepID=UPI0037C737DF